MAPKDKKPKQAKLVCYCNAVPRAQVEQAIKNGCKTLGEIFDQTLAGVGACGGSCQPDLKIMLEQYLKTSRSK